VKSTNKIPAFLLIVLLAFSMTALCQDDQSTPTLHDQTRSSDQSSTAQPSASEEGLGSPIKLIAHTTKAVDYKQGSESHVDMKGTSMMPDATGEAEVKTHTGHTDVEVKLDRLKPANSFGLEDLTYVLWAISPEGRPSNIGELVEKDGKARINTSTPLQSFALVVTAEPYYAVTQPSDLIVAENVPGKDTKGFTREVDANYQAIPHNIYASHVEPIDKPVYGMDKKTPLSLLEARNAVRIAKAANADEYAAAPFNNAQQLLSKAEDYYSRKQPRNAIDTVAREATQTAEEARVMAVRGAEQARIDREQREAADRARQAREEAARAQDDAQRAQAARDAAAAQAAAAQAQADQARQQAEFEAQQRAQLAAQQQAAAQQAAQAQAAAQQAQEQAQREAQQRAAAEQAQQQAEQARQQAAMQAQQSQLEAQQAQQQMQAAQQQAQQAEAERQQMRTRLMDQLNQVLQTRDSARGLIVSMPDVLFDLNSANLKPTARERLAKVAGILIAYPDVKVEIDGYTDNTGTASYNQQLSEQRAASVQAYLTRQGVPGSSITTRGFGMDNPIASNDSPSGRQQNRRVELVVSGQSIGAQMNTPAVP